MSELEDIDDHERPRYTTRRLRHEIDRAVAVERERCVRVAESFLTKDDQRGLLDDFGVGRDGVIRGIVDAIRTQ